MTGKKISNIVGRLMGRETRQPLIRVWARCWAFRVSRTATKAVACRSQHPRPPHHPPPAPDPPPQLRSEPRGSSAAASNPIQPNSAEFYCLGQSACRPGLIAVFP
jgi:hypothetical protein